MNRIDIIKTIGEKYLETNQENGEFNYRTELKKVGIKIEDLRNSNKPRHHEKIDLRFESDRLVVLVETKTTLTNRSKIANQQQLQEYVIYEKALNEKKIVALLVGINDGRVQTWHGESVIIDDNHVKEDQDEVLPMSEYEEICLGSINDKTKVVDSINQLNVLLHQNGIVEKIRSQLVGTFLLALKNGLVYEGIKPTIDSMGKNLNEAQVIIKDIKNILRGIVLKDVIGEENKESNNFVNKASKLSILDNKVLDDQGITSLTYKDLQQILKYIDVNIIPYINDKNTAGQDLLNLFFTTFNKYVGKSDKNQAFTPDHICSFMSKAIQINKNSVILDPCCGSGAFLVRAMTDAMDDCSTEDERKSVKNNQIFGIEYEDGAFGLASTNMLIHGDGNSNIVQDSLFNKANWIQSQEIDAVLMNPPYNATKKHCDPSYVKDWTAKTTQDPSKGLHYVEWVMRHVGAKNSAKLAVLLPMQAAIGNSQATKDFKEKIMKLATLDAVFSLPDEVFYPGASVVACCMIFDLKQPHKKADRETFFGYFKEDNFIKRKGLGRIDKVDGSGRGLWEGTQQHWLDLYRNKRIEPGLSVMKKVSPSDEWLAEAYMETDYSTISDADFQQTVNDYVAHLVKSGELNK